MNYKYYNAFRSQKINTGELWSAVKQCEENFQHSDLVEFRENLQSLLFDYKKVTVKFDPTSWRYHRENFLRFNKSEWFNEGKDVFEPDFFMENARSSGEIQFNELSDEQKLSILDPPTIFNFSSNDSPNIESTEKEKKEILSKLNQRKAGINSEDDNDPYDWYRWGYDIYTLYQDFEIDISQNPDEFEYFFVWRLAVTDLTKIKDFLFWHLENTFQNKVDDFTDYIEIMFLKYKQILADEDKKLVVSKNLEKKIIKGDLVSAIPNLDNGIQKIEIRKKKEKLEIPITMERNNTDTYTILTAQETVILFEYLSEVRAILSQSLQYEFLKTIDKAKAIQVLTGFSHGGLTDHIESTVQRKNKKAIRNVKQIMAKINELIIRDLA